MIEKYESVQYKTQFNSLSNNKFKDLFNSVPHSPDC